MGKYHSLELVKGHVSLEFLLHHRKFSPIFAYQTTPSNGEFSGIMEHQVSNSVEKSPGLDHGERIGVLLV